LAVELEFISIAIPIANVDRVYPGGFEGYKTDWERPFGRALHDEHLLVISVMNPMDAQWVVDTWEEWGLEPFGEVEGEKAWKDLCIVDYIRGPTLPCDWIEYGYEAAWLKGEPRGEVVSYYSREE